MATSPSLWSGNYRGAVYPMDYFAAPVDFSPRARQMKTLVELSAEKIVQDSDMTRVAISIIPKPLYVPLMKEALLKNRELSIQCIVGSWPIPVLVLHHLVPQLFTSVQPLYSMEYLDYIVRQGLRYTTSLVHTFLEALKNNTDTKLKVLDLTGYPTAEVIVYFLATHCMLAHNEVRHETIRNIYEQTLQQAGKSDVACSAEPMEPFEHSLPHNCSVIVKLDVFVTSESTHSELCKALKVSSFHNRKLSIMIGRLAVTCLGQARISLLVKQINPEYLTGLQLQYNALTAQDFVKMAPALKSLVCLESLDLSCNCMFFHQHEDACIAVGQVFSCMPRLHRLDLSNNRIKTRLRRLLENIKLPLTFLRLAGCALTVTDLVFLAHSVHRTQLSELDLSENNLRHCDRQMQAILTAAKTTLCVLHLEDCYLDNYNIHNYCLFLSQLSSLIFVSFAENRLHQDCQESLLATVAELVTLQVFKSSYALECYASEEEEDRLKASSAAQLVKVASRSNVKALRSIPLKVELTDLGSVLEIG